MFYAIQKIMQLYWAATHLSSDMKNFRAVLLDYIIMLVVMQKVKGLLDCIYFEQ